MAKKTTKSTQLNHNMRVVILRGKDRFQILENTKKFAELLSEEFGEIDQFTYDGDSATLADVLDELRSYGLLHTHKLVILTRADRFLTGEGHRAGLERYLEKPVEEASLLMQAETWRPGRIDKIVNKIGAIIKCDPPTVARATKWCIARCQKQHDCTLENNAAALLVDQVGTDLARLDMELGKLAAYAGEVKTIDRSMVEEMIGLSREDQVWAIQSSIVSGRPENAIRKLRELLQVANQPMELVNWAVIDLLRKLHTASCLLRQGEPPGSVAKACKLWGDTQRPILSIAQSHTPDQIAQLLQQAIERDMKVKWGIGQADRSLEVFTLHCADTISSA